MPIASGIASVSPCTTVIDSIGMPSSFWTSIAQAVWCPCPCAELPVNTVAAPVSSTTTRAVSPPMSPAVIST